MSDDRIVHPPAAVGIVAGLLVFGSLIGLHLHFDNERQIERLRQEPASTLVIEACES